MSNPAELDRLAGAVKALASSNPGWAFDSARAESFLAIGDCLEQLVREGSPSDLHKVYPNPVWDLVEPRLASVLDDISTTLGADDVVLWQGYSSSVVVRDGNRVVGFDVLPLPRFYDWPDRSKLTERYADILDTLFITHRHEDHFDRALVAACLDRGKTVFLPASCAEEWSGRPGCIAVTDGLSFEKEGLAVTGKEGIHVWRERPEEVPLVYYDVTLPCGYRLVYGGDVDYTKQFEVASGPDLLFVTWRAPNARYEPGDPGQTGNLIDATRVALARANPRALLFEHYAELDHIYNGFPASYDLALGVQKQLAQPCEILFWGERISL